MKGCYSQESPECDRALGIAACRALILNNPESPLPRHCDLLINNESKDHVPASVSRCQHWYKIKTNNCFYSVLL